MSSVIKRILKRFDASHTKTAVTGFRSDAQYRLPGELYEDVSEPLDPRTHYTPLYTVDDHDSASDRETVASYDGHAHMWVYSIAQNVFDDWFEFVDPSSNEPIEAMESTVQERFDQLRLREVLPRACAEERKHGWSVVYKLYEGARNRTPEEEGLTYFMGDDMAFVDTPIRGPREILGLQVLPMEDTTMQEVETLTNKPELIRYTSSIPEEGPIGASNVNVDVHGTRCWIITPRPKKRTWLGYTALEPVWEILYTLRQHLDSLTFIAQKYGLTIPYIEHDGDLTSTESDRMEAALKNLSKRRYLMVQPTIWRNFELKTPDVSKAGLEGQIDILYGMLAAVTGLPKTRWMGAQAGDLTASRTNLKLEYGVISRIQAQYDPIIRSIVNDLFPTNPFTAYKIKWKLEYQMDKLEEAEVLNMMAGAIPNLAQALTMEEIRKRLGYTGSIDLAQTVAGQQQAQRLQASKELGMGLQAAGSASQTPTAMSSLPSEPSRADAVAAIDRGEFPEFVAYWEGMGFSKNRQIKLCRMGRSTFYEHLKRQETRQVDLRL